MRNMFLVLAPFLISGCMDFGSEPESVKKAKSEVLYFMKDPESTQFRNIVYNTKFVCGEVNSKNSYGAYGGFTPFIVDFDNTRWLNAGDKFWITFKNAQPVQSTDLVIQQMDAEIKILEVQKTSPSSQDHDIYFDFFNKKYCKNLNSLK